MLPVWDRPEGAFSAWVYAGIVHPVDGRSPYRLTGAGMVEADYEHQTIHRIGKIGDWLHFRARVPHALRAAPRERSRRITWIGLDHELTLIERRDDWLRVRVRQPAWTCVSPGHEFKGRIDVGWCPAS